MYEMNTLKTFNELTYTRPDFEALKEFYKGLTERLLSAKSFEDVQKCIKDEE